MRVVCAHPAATEKAVLNALAERTALLTDAVGGLSTLVTDRVLVREGQRVAAELALLQKRQQVRWCGHLSVTAANTARLVFRIWLPLTPAGVRGVMTKTNNAQLDDKV